MSTKNTQATVVLVHAAWADGSSWNKVTLQLRERGFDVVAAQIPLTSLHDDTAVLQRILTRQEGPVVLAGHSYGGAVITAAAAGNPNVKALVYIAAIAPDAGETVAISSTACRLTRAPPSFSPTPTASFGSLRTPSATPSLQMLRPLKSLS